MSSVKKLLLGEITCYYSLGQSEELISQGLISSYKQNLLITSTKLLQKKKIIDKLQFANPEYFLGTDHNVHYLYSYCVRYIGTEDTCHKTNSSPGRPDKIIIDVRKRAEIT